MMRILKLHDWNLSPSDAIAKQKELVGYLSLKDNFLWHDIGLLAGVDVGFPRGKDIARAAVALLRFPSLEPVEGPVYEGPATFPYIPGLLSFREIPVILKAIKELHCEPDIWLCDGQGIAHPRGLGLAAHLGLILDKPVIGVAKSRLTGQFERVPVNKGEWMPLFDKQKEIIGAVLCTKDNTKPLYISPGNHISLETSIKIVMACLTRYRLPETTRMAHHLASHK